MMHIKPFDCISFSIFLRIKAIFIAPYQFPIGQKKNSKASISNHPFCFRFLYKNRCKLFTMSFLFYNFSLYKIAEKMCSPISLMQRITQLNTEYLNIRVSIVVLDGRPYTGVPGKIKTY